MEEARSAEDKGELDNAEKLLSRAARANPEDPEVHRQLARLMIGQGQRDAAVEHLQYAVNQDPANPAAFVQLAQILSHEGNLQESLLSVDAALELDPTNTAALLLKGSLAEKEQRDELALETYHRILGSDPANTEALLRIAAIHVRSGRPSRAAPMLRSVCESSDGSSKQKSQAQWLLGVAYGAQGRWPDAIAALSQSVEVRTEVTADDWYRLAYARFQMSDYEGCQSDLKDALRENPQHAPSLALASTLRTIDRQRTNAVVPARFVAGRVPVPTGWSETALERR